MESLPHEFPRKPRYCVNCKKPLPPDAARNRKYCNECRTIVARQKARDYEQKVRTKKKIQKKGYVPTMSWKPDQADVNYCKPCIYSEPCYWRHLCNFYSKTGIRRGCKAGVGCNRREIGSSLNGKSI